MSHLFENNKLPLERFQFTFTVWLLLYSLENIALQMTLLFSFDQVVADNLFSFGPFDVQNTNTTTNPPPPKKKITMQHKRANNFLLIICSNEHLNFCICFPPELSPYCLCFSYSRDVRRRQRFSQMLQRIVCLKLPISV